MLARAVLPVLVLFVLVAEAQEFAIKKIELTPAGMVLHYDLADTTGSSKYTINVYSSADNFLTPLKHVTGDVGLEVAPGFDRKITWDSRKELGENFHGEIALEIRGRVYVPFIKFSAFDEGRIIRRAARLLVTWSGGSRQDLLNFAIYKNDQLVSIIPNIPNSGNYELTIPATLKPGKDYHFLITDSKNKDQAARTPVFEIRRKIPLGIKAAAVAAAGFVAVAIMSSGRPDYIESPPASPGSN